MFGRAALAIVVALGACIASAGPLSAKGGPEDTERVFIRTTDNGVTIRAFRGSYADGVFPEPCTGPGCPPPACQVQGALIIGFSNEAAVSEGWAELYRPGDDELRTVMASGFGSPFDAPAAWVALQTGDGVARVRATFRDGRTDEMRPREHLVVLASPVRGTTAEYVGPTGRAVAFDADGKVVGRVQFGPDDPFESPPAHCIGGLDGEFPEATGPPPADEAAARAAVTAAVSSAYQPGAEPLAQLAAVEDGAALATVLNIAAERYPQYRGKVSAAVEEVRFVNESDGAVRFALLVDGQAIAPAGVGRVTLIDGKWLLTRDTFCRLLQLGGVYCPAPDKDV